MSQDPAALELRGITKRFGAVVANDGVDFELRRGEVHALLGENGAGKSTLMSILYGVYRPTEGEILVDDKPVQIDSPADAIALGIGMVHQHFMLVPVMTVTENMVLGREPSNAGMLDMKEARARVREVSDRYGLAVDPDAVIEDVTVGMQQRVEILKALFRGARDPRPRRADRRADRAGGQRAVRRAAGTAGGRHVDRLHQPQAQRGARRSPTA